MNDFIYIIIDHPICVSQNIKSIEPKLYGAKCFEDFFGFRSWHVYTSMADEVLLALFFRWVVVAISGRRLRKINCVVESTLLCPQL